MGLVHAFNKGDVKGSEVSKKVKDVAKGMKKSDVKKYASTKHKGKPEKYDDIQKKEFEKRVKLVARQREQMLEVREKRLKESKSSSRNRIIFAYFLFNLNI